MGRSHVFLYVSASIRVKLPVGGINAQHAARPRRMLTALHTANGPENMNQPSFKLHSRQADRKGQWAVWLSGNWRFVFEFDGTDAINVDLVDYH
ncbi:MAG TPA: type II toxin-antitoxin system RelE/ParE family toxin [Acetobacteraceae bacterium]|jgi:proteic killer suppression protein